MEIETGFEYVKQAEKEYNSSFVLKYGIFKNADFGIEVPYQFIDKKEAKDIDGFSDTVFSFKYHTVDEKENIPALAFGFSVKTKSANEDKTLGSGTVDYTLKTILTKQIKFCSTHFNLGYTVKDEPEGRDENDVLFYNLAVEYPLNESFNLTAEVTGETVFEGNFNDNPFSGLIGFNYSLNKNITYDIGTGFQISEASPDYRLVSGFTVSF
jgi:hypothetical protein